MNDDRELLELRGEYLADVREKTALIRSHAKLASADGEFKSAFPRLLFLSHQLRGSGGSLGYPRISELAGIIHSTLSEFLEAEEALRPTPDELSVRIAKLTGELEIAVSESEFALSKVREDSRPAS